MVLPRCQRGRERGGGGRRGRRGPLLERRLERHRVEDGLLRRDLLHARRVRTESQRLDVVVLNIVLLFG